jgi:DeoR/GlpR family transcriptional regulator of sugar metabolism
MNERLFRQERLDQIASLLHEHGRVAVVDLSERFGVSPMTIRSDLAALEQQGLVLRTHGGALLKPESSLEPAFLLRKDLHQAEKERIGQAAASLVQDGESIVLDASTTAWQVARQLKDRNELTVVTNGLFIALELLDAPGVTVVMPGGALRSGSASVVGDVGACLLERYHVQKGFFGARGFTLHEGLTDVNQYEVDLKRLMVKHSKEVIGIVDGSKWGQVAFATFARLDEVDRFIVDDGAPEEMVTTLQQLGIKLMLV